MSRRLLRNHQEVRLSESFREKMTDTQPIVLSVIFGDRVTQCVLLITISDISFSDGPFTSSRIFPSLACWPVIGRARRPVYNKLQCCREVAESLTGWGMGLQEWGIAPTVTGIINKLKLLLPKNNVKIIRNKPMFPLDAFFIDSG